MADGGSRAEGGEYSYSVAQGDGRRDTVYVTFIEPIIVGPLGPWSLLKNGVELHAASPFAAFSPVVPYMNSMQISMQFNQDSLRVTCLFWVVISLVMAIPDSLLM